MSERIDASREYITRYTQWAIDEKTFRIIDEEKAMWVAIATTTHNHRADVPEVQFAILARDTGYITIDPALLPAIGQWIAEQTDKKP